MKTNSVHYTIIGIAMQPKEADANGFLDYREGFDLYHDSKLTDSERVIRDQVKRIEAWRDNELGSDTDDSLPDTIESSWHYKDVLSIAPKLTDDQAREVLRRVDRNHDASTGINWEVLELHADALIAEFPTKPNYTVRKDLVEKGDSIPTEAGGWISDGYFWGKEREDDKGDEEVEYNLTLNDVDGNFVANVYSIDMDWIGDIKA